MADDPVEIVTRVAELLQRKDLAEVVNDQARWEEATRPVRDLAHPDLAGAMIGPDYAGGTIEFEGLEGLRRAWVEWVSPFETFSTEVDEVECSGDTVLTVVRQRGKTRTGGVEVEAPASAVWTVRDGQILRIEFHLDPDRARRVAGLGG